MPITISGSGTQTGIPINGTLGTTANPSNTSAVTPNLFGASLASAPAAVAAPAAAQQTAQSQANAQAAAAATAKANAQAVLNNNTNSAVSSSNSALDSYLATLQNQGLGVSNAYQTGELGINQDRQTVNENKLSSLDDLANTVRQGLNTSQLGLGNANGLNSSGAEGAARAYSEFGAQGANQVNGGANLALTQDDDKQSLLDQQLQGGLQQLGSSRNSYINAVQNQIQSALDSVSTQAQQQGLSGPDVATMVNNIVNNGRAMLGAVDGQVASTAHSVGATSNADAALAAANAYAQGYQPTNGTVYSFGSTPTQTTSPNANTVDPGILTALPLFTKDQGS